MKKFQITTVAFTTLIAAAAFWPTTEPSIADEAMKMAQHSHTGLPSPLPITPDDMTRRERFPYEPQTPTYPVIGAAWYANPDYTKTLSNESPQIGDGTLPHGGLAPAITAGKEPPIIPSNFSRVGWKFSGGTFNHVPSTEEKFRTHCNYSHHAWEDPILYPNRRGPYGNSHLHTFFGNTEMGADSTYQTLRTTGGSTCAGGPINRSGYWYPSVLKDNAIGDGKTMIVKPNMAVVYYVVGKGAGPLAHRFPRGFQYISGFDLGDPTLSARAAELTAARAASVAGGGYDGPNAYEELTNSQNGVNGFLGWKCESSIGGNHPNAVRVPGWTGSYQPYLKNDDGTPTMICPTGEMIGFVTNTQTCWDGVNLWSPNGRSHVRYPFRNNSGRSNLCPTGWFRLPSFQLIIWFSQDGEDDTKNWYFSSDRVPGGTTYKNGETGHSDWYGAWDWEEMTAWMVNCTGITTETQTGNPQECDNSTLGDGNRLLISTAAPDGTRNPQVSLTELPADNTRFDVMPENR